ncbi:hypothetical protein AOA80_07580 [Methanomassiliicoccales archaeon RumEn M1]|jgi:hypothetical protein|nr:hypothetical protein AOA80_07580 [Methanomassiliicoccales archaeon RumEn M1]
MNIGHQSVMMDRGRTYLVYEKRMERTGHLARQLGEMGSRVLTATRLHPSLVAERTGLDADESIWLSERAGAGNVPPDQLNRLFQRISAFLSENPDGTVMLEGVEYILQYNDVKKVLATVERVNDVIMSSQAVLIISIDPMTLDPRTLAYLRRWAEIIE